MDRLQYILNRIPQFYDKENSASLVNTLISAISEEISDIDTQMEYLGSMLTIDSSMEYDLDKRWGALLGVVRVPGESHADYAFRLASSITQLNGGTEQVLRYAASVALGMDISYISVVDAWIPTDINILGTTYGYVFVFINNPPSGVYHYDTARLLLDKVKASGVCVQIVDRLNIASTNITIQENLFKQGSTYNYRAGLWRVGTGDPIAVIESEVQIV